MVNLYDTYRLIQAIEGLNPAANFLNARYAPTNDGTDIFDSEKVLAEFRDGDRRLAPFVVDYANGVALSRVGQRMVEYTPPTVAPQRTLTLDDVNKRGFGEALMTDLSPEARAMVLALRDMTDLSNAVFRRIELMTAEVLLTNGCKMKAIGDDLDAPVENEVLFYQEEANPAQVAITTDWNEPTADILGDMGKMVRKLTREGLPAKEFVCGPDVADYIINNDGVQKMLDNRRIEIGSVAPTLEADDAAVECVLNIHGHMISVISYDGTYRDEKGKTQPYITEGYGVMTAPASLRTLYGAVTQVEQADGEFHTYKGRLVPKYESNTHNNTRLFTLTSRPLVIPNDVNPMVSVKCVSE